MTSSNVQALMWLVAELDIEHQRIDAGHRFGFTDSDEFYRMNPNRSVPVIRDGDDEYLWETGAILRYLAGKHAPDSFWPANPSDRAQVDKWAEWAKVYVSGGFNLPVFWQVVRTPEAERDPGKITASIKLLEDRMAIAEERLSRLDWLAGDHFTLADIQFGHTLFRYFDIEITRREFPAIRAYYERLVSRNAYRDNVMIAYEDLRA